MTIRESNNPLSLPLTRSEHKLSARGWHSRGFLPHFDSGSVPQHLTFRLADSLPLKVLRAINAELAHLAIDEANEECFLRVDKVLDEGLGERWLSKPEIAMIVQSALLFHDGERYQLHAWVIMPNHVHVLITPNENQSLSKIVHSWKSFTANQANKTIGRKGEFWQSDYFDRFIRDGDQFERARQYIENNPVKGGLCNEPREWAFSSACLVS